MNYDYEWVDHDNTMEKCVRFSLAIIFHIHATLRAHFVPYSFGAATQKKRKLKQNIIIYRFEWRSMTFLSGPFA